MKDFAIRLYLSHIYVAHKKETPDGVEEKIKVVISNILCLSNYWWGGLHDVWMNVHAKTLVVKLQ